MACLLQRSAGACENERIRLKLIDQDPPVAERYRHSDKLRLSLQIMPVLYSYKSDHHCRFCTNANKSLSKQLAVVCGVFQVEGLCVTGPFQVKQGPQKGTYQS